MIRKTIVLLFLVVITIIVLYLFLVASYCSPGDTGRVRQLSFLNQKLFLPDRCVPEPKKVVDFFPYCELNRNVYVVLK